MEIKKLIQHIEQIIPLAQEEQHKLEVVVKQKRVRRRQFLLQEGDVCKSYNFVIEGCFRMFMVDEKGAEHIVQFATENWWVADIGSFHNELPSNFYIEALEPSVVLQIKKEDLLKLYVGSPKFDRYFRVLVENAFIKMQNRVVQNISSTAEERYQSFLNSYPQLSNRIPQIHIASYIGVTPEFLSKVRKNLMK